MKKRLITLFICFVILVSLASCGQEEQINLANTPIADHTAYRDKILYGDVRAYNHNSIKYEVPDSYEDQYTNCGILKVLTFEGAPDTIMSYMGIDYQLFDSYQKKFSYYTTEDIISFVGIDYKGYIPETREKFTIEYCSESKEIVSLIDHSAYKVASTQYHTVGEELPIQELAEIAKKILVEDYKKNIDFSKYTMYCNAIVPNESISDLGSYHTKRFYWRRYVHGVCVHQISVDLRHDGVLQKFVCPPAFDESAIEKIPNLTEEQYIDLALNFVKDVYKSSGEKASIGNIAIDHNTWHDHEEIRNSTYHMMPTMRLVYLDHPQRMYAIKYRFIWSSFYEDGSYNTYEQDFYIPVQTIQSDDNSVPSSAETSVTPTESGTVGDDSSSEPSESKPYKDDKMSECIVMTTDKTEYSINDKVTITISTNHKYEHSIWFDENYYIEYYENGEWHKCEKEYSINDYDLGLGFMGIYETTRMFDIEERIIEGYEKYRIVNEFHSDTHNTELIYSNEFTLIP